MVVVEVVEVDATGDAGSGRTSFSLSVVISSLELYFLRGALRFDTFSTSMNVSKTDQN